MLACYPIAATAENWLHQALLGKVRAALEALNAGNPVPDWSVDMDPRLANRVALETRYIAFCAAAEKLSIARRTTIIEALLAQNNIPAVFDGHTDCPRLNSLPLGIRTPAKDLFKAGFSALTSLGIRNRQFEINFNAIPGKCCPFCGIEPFEAPGLAQEDLDHYLPRSVYPFAGANLRNLATMGGKCNTAYKNAKDVICDRGGQRRRCFDPYGEAKADVSLMQSRPFEREVDGKFPLPEWEVELLGDADLVATWDEVFQVRRRFKGKIDAHFREWTEHFAYWCAREVGLIETQEAVVSALSRYLNAVLHLMRGEGSRLKQAMFEMMHQHCQDGDQSDRLVAWFSALVANEIRQLEVDGE